MKDYSHITQQDYEVIAGPEWPLFDEFKQHQNIPDFVYNEIDSRLRPPGGFVNTCFCVNPFYSLEMFLQRETPCCLLPKNPDIEKIKQQMLDGVRPKECYKCWELENQGLTSDRIIKNAAADFYTNRDLEFLIEDSRLGKNKIVFYKIDTSNTCNAACVTCSSRFSSTWGQLMQQNELDPLKNWQIKPQDLSVEIDYANAQTMVFRGGEPTLSKTNFWILEQLIKHGNTKCFISFVTNGSFNISQDQLDLLKQFSTVNFTFSIDGVGPVFEYMRWPLKWNTVVNNIAWCRDNGFDVSSSYTVSNVNLMYHEDTVAWFEQNSINYTINLVDAPAYLKYNVLSSELKDQVKQRWKTDRYLELLKLDKNHKELFEETKLMLRQQDSWKKVNIQDYLPEVAKFL